MDMKKWFKEAQYGMMIHWGLYSVLGGEWKNHYSEAYAEWIQATLAIPNAEYAKLANVFNPIYFNAEDWVKFAKGCGMQYMVLTSKHHDGFAMFRSKVDPYNIFDATPFKRDVVAELAEACYKHGLKLGLYYSQDLDWHEKHGGGYLSNPDWSAGITWENSWDFPNKAEKDYSICFENKIMPQIEEILRNYGELCLVWFDMPLTINKQQSMRIYEAIKRYQPECLINSRLGNGDYDYVSLGDNEIPESLPENQQFDPKLLNDIDGFKPSPYGLYETAATMNDSWGFCTRDQNWKTAEMIYTNKKKLNGMGINYLLNVGPDALGRIPLRSREILQQVAEMEK